MVSKLGLLIVASLIVLVASEACLVIFSASFVDWAIQSKSSLQKIEAIKSSVLNEHPDVIVFGTGLHRYYYVGDTLYYC